MLHAFGQVRAVVATDDDLVVAAPERPDLLTDDFALVCLRVNDPHAGRGDEQMVDVAAGAWDETIEERDDVVADLLRNPGSEATLAGAPFPPRRFDLLRSKLFGHDGCVVAVPTAHLLDPTINTTRSLRRG